jgi:hypothetical protein
MKRRINIVLVSILAGVLLGHGCVTLKALMRPPGKNNFRAVCKVRPIIVTSGGEFQWTAEKFKEYTDMVNPAYQKTGIYFEFLPFEYVENPSWYECPRKSLFFQMAAESKRIADERGELVVWLTQRLDAYYGAGAVSNLPSRGLVGTYQQHGLAISYWSHAITLAHELGHAFDVIHPWLNDGIDDTNVKDADDCETDVCNIMTFCFFEDRSHCKGKEFTPGQIDHIQEWARKPPRNQVIQILGK